MALTVTSLAECVKRWAEKTDRAVRDALENPQSQAEYDWALGFATGNLRKLTRKANGQAILTFNQAQLRESGLGAADRVIVLSLPEGGALIRRASEEDVIAAHSRYASTAFPVFPPKPRPEDLPEIEKRCPQCGLSYYTRSPRRVFCDECRRQRLRAQWRASWHRKGKFTPSYQAKLKGATRPEAELQPAFVSRRA